MSIVFVETLSSSGRNYRTRESHKFNSSAAPPRFARLTHSGVTAPVHHRIYTCTRVWSLRTLVWYNDESSRAKAKSSHTTLLFPRAKLGEYPLPSIKLSTNNVRTTDVKLWANDYGTTNNPIDHRRLKTAYWRAELFYSFHMHLCVSQVRSSVCAFWGHVVLGSYPRECCQSQFAMSWSHWFTSECTLGLQVG